MMGPFEIIGESLRWITVPPYSTIFVTVFLIAIDIGIIYVLVQDHRRVNGEKIKSKSREEDKE